MSKKYKFTNYSGIIIYYYKELLFKFKYYKFINPSGTINSV